MKMVIRQMKGASPDDPVELWLESNYNGVVVKARKGAQGTVTHLLHISKEGIVLCNNVDRSVGFDLYGGKMKVQQ